MSPRLLRNYLLRDPGYCPVVTLTGPRQSGKTTLARTASPHHGYVSLEETDMRAIAREDPRGFLERFPRSVVIDEAQRTPDLLSHLQSAVDHDPRTGRLVLTC